MYLESKIGNGKSYIHIYIHLIYCKYFIIYIYYSMMLQILFHSITANGR